MSKVWFPAVGLFCRHRRRNVMLKVTSDASCFTVKPKPEKEPQFTVRQHAGYLQPVWSAVSVIAQKLIHGFKQQIWTKTSKNKLVIPLETKKIKLLPNVVWCFRGVKNILFTICSKHSFGYQTKADICGLLSSLYYPFAFVI